MRRRKYITLAGSALTAALAGCTGEESSPDTDDSDEGASADTTTAPTSAETPNGETTSEEETTKQTSQSAWSFGPRTFEGSGTETSDEIDLSTGPITAEFSHDGEMNFITELITLEGESYQDVTLTNLIGNVEGSTVAAVSASGGHKLNVDADGEWSITLEQPADPSPKSLPIDASGNGRTYIGPFEFSGATEFQATHGGSSNFIVTPVPVDPSNIAMSIFNKIGQFEGSTTSRLDGVFYLDIDAGGKWTISTA